MNSTRLIRTFLQSGPHECPTEYDKLLEEAVSPQVMPTTNAGCTRAFDGQ